MEQEHKYQDQVASMVCLRLFSAAAEPGPLGVRSVSVSPYAGQDTRPFEPIDTATLLRCFHYAILVKG
jgi:hypothetical protein